MKQKPMVFVIWTTGVLWPLKWLQVCRRSLSYVKTVMHELGVHTLIDEAGKSETAQARLYDESKLLMDMGFCQHENVLRLLGICSQKGTF